jgi:hypothetical protein
MDTLSFHRLHDAFDASFLSRCSCCNLLPLFQRAAAASTRGVGFIKSLLLPFASVDTRL